MNALAESLERRVVDVVGTDCRVWIGALFPEGGFIRVDGRWRAVGRVAWELAYGPLPPGYRVFRTCSIKACVKPEHLTVAAGDRRAAGILPNDYIVDANGCWIWQHQCCPAGYGRAGQSLAAHRLAYEWAKGPIPDGLTVDHLCYVRNCINPDHLEAVTLGENTRRAWARRRAREATARAG